ncbi:MAG TPA: type II secretion system F family protein [Acidimicrobiia bacterium]|nr:type II secretion system F family protein [Acidimicrobiia bacterium]
MWVAGLCILAAGAGLPPRLRTGAATAAAAVVSPWLAVACLAALVALNWLRRMRMRRAAALAIANEVPLLGDLVSLGLSGGRPFTAALAAAGRQLESPLAGEVDRVVRQITHNGAAVALAAADGAALRLYQLAGRALSTGAPLGAAVQEFTDEVRAKQHSARLAAARRLPVILMVPLALLILPGFVLLTVAPAVVGAVERIGL